MAYEKQTWNTGDTITAAKLNHMEDGIGNSMQYPENAYFVNLTYDDDSDIFTSDKTFSEILSAHNDGKSIYGIFSGYDAYGYEDPATVSLQAVYDSTGNDIVAFSHIDIININTITQLTDYCCHAVAIEENVTVGFVSITSAKITVPTFPSGAGTYVLKLTVTNDGSTMSWVAE